MQEVLVDDSGASSCFTSPKNAEKAIPGTRVKLARPRKVKLGASHSFSRYAHIRQILLRKAHEPRVALVMNVAVYETDEFHKDCTLIGEDVLREAGIETTTAKGEGPYTYKRSPEHRSHPYTLRDDMVGSNLKRLRNGLKAFDVGDAGDFTKFVCYATGKTVEPGVIGTMEGLDGHGGNPGLGS